MALYLGERLGRHAVLVGLVGCCPACEEDLNDRGVSIRSSKVKRG